MFGIIIFFVIKHKRLNKSFDDSEDFNDSEYEEENDDEFEQKEEKINLDEEAELFRRVNKSKFSMLENSNATETNEQNIAKTSIKDEEEKTEFIENYFRNLDNKRKGKHF